MRSRELLRRLARLGPPDEEQPKKTLDLSRLSRVEEAHLFEVWPHREEGVTEADVAECRALWDRCIVDPGEVGHREKKTPEEILASRKLKVSFSRAFHDYAMQYTYIAIPERYYNALNEYRLDLGYRLFEKYGWVVGERDCSGILPLDQWALEDRDALIDLYQRSEPECTAALPPGWNSKYKSGRVV
jgi:hypothetical protein